MKINCKFIAILFVLVLAGNCTAAEIDHNDNPSDTLIKKRINLGFVLGGGYGKAQGSFGNAVNPLSPYRLGFNIRYRKITLEFGSTIIYGHLLDDRLEFLGVFETDNLKRTGEMSFFQLYVKAGLRLVDNENSNLTIFVGVGWPRLSYHNIDSSRNFDLEVYQYYPGLLASARYNFKLYDRNARTQGGVYGFFEVSANHWNLNSAQVGQGTVYYLVYGISGDVGVW